MVEFIRKRLFSKTYGLAILVALSGLMVSKEETFRILLADHYEIVSLILGVVIAILREMTTKPIQEK